MAQSDSLISAVSEWGMIYSVIPATTHVYTCLSNRQQSALPYLAPMTMSSYHAVVSNPKHHSTQRQRDANKDQRKPIIRR